MRVERANNRVAFSGRLRVRGRARSRAPGRYGGVLRATHLTGKQSLPKRVSFLVVRGSPMT